MITVIKGDELIKDNAPGAKPYKEVSVEISGFAHIPVFMGGPETFIDIKLGDKVTRVNARELAAACAGAAWAAEMNTAAKQAHLFGPAGTVIPPQPQSPFVSWSPPR